MIRSCSFFVCLLFIANALSAQELVIRYDYISGTASYFHRYNGNLVPAKKVSISEGSQVSIEVTNVNPYLWNVQGYLLEAKSNGFNLGGGIQSLMADLKLSPAGLMKGLFGSNPLANMMGARGTETSALGLLRETGAAFYEVVDSLKTLQAIQTRLHLLESLLDNLKFSDKISEQDFKGKLNEYVNNYAGWPAKEMDKAMNCGGELDAQKNSYIDSLHLLYEQVHLYAGKTPESASLFPESGMNVHDFLITLDSSYKRILQQLAVFENENSFSQIHYRLFQKYNSLVSTSFMQQQLVVSPFVSDQMKLIFRNKLQKDSLIKMVALPNRAKTRVFNTNGVVVPFFKENRYTYYVDQTGTIQTDGLASITPYLAAQINVLNSSTKGLKWGYTLGLGLPLSSDKSFVVTTGLACYFGKNEMFGLAAGIAGTKTKTLARGLKIGDRVTDPLNPLPYKELIAIAPFTSLSVNIAALK